MTTARRSRHLLDVLPLGFAMLLLLPWSAAAQPTTYSFVQNAYLAVGITPSCSQISLEADQLNFQSTFAAKETEAARFVSSLFEAPAFGTYFQTTLYQERNSSGSGRTSDFVTDLYEAFLQHAPDAGGLAFWVAQVNQSPTPRAFGVAAFSNTTNDTEFRALVDSLSAVTVNCQVGCSPGTSFVPWVSQCQ